MSPTLWTDGAGRLRGLVGTRGGNQQPQILAQVCSLLFGAGRTPAEAQAAPRWAIPDITVATSVLEAEAGFDPVVTDGLAARGHVISSSSRLMGGGGPVSIIGVGEDGLRTAAADPRVDTAAAATR